MPIQRFITITLTLAGLSIAAACAPTSAGQPVWSSPSQEENASATIPSGSFTITSTKYPTRTRPNTPTITPTNTPLDDTSILLPGWVPEGARARIGRGIINQIALSPDGKTVAVAGATGLSLFTTDSFQEVWSIPTQTEVTHVSFLEDGLTIATLSLDDGFDEVSIGSCYGKCFFLERIYLWNTVDGGLKKSLPVNFSSSFKPLITFSDAGDLMAIAGSSGGTVDVWNLASGSKFRQWVNTPIEGMDLSFDGHSLATNYGKTVCIWGVDTGESFICWEAPEELGEDFDKDNFELSPDGRFLASGWGRTITLWDPSSGRIIRRLKTQLSPSALLFSSDGSRLANGSAGGVELWNLNTGDSIGITERIFQSRMGESPMLR
ncbi:MAG: hypothetical protein WBM17_08385, partial [Anaerolineales bacterium]